MKFGAVPPREAEGAIAVHSIRKDGMVLKKGTLVGKSEIAALEAAKVSEIVVARLEPGDVSEDVAAAEIAAAVAGEGVHVDRAFTGRANLFAEHAGVLVVDRQGVDALNDVDPAITFATLDAYAPVVAGKMIATVKIIPFAVAGDARDRAVAAARGAKPIVRVAPFRVHKVGIISTLLPGPRRQGDREDPEGDGRAARARGRDDRGGAARAARDQGAGARRSTRCSRPAPRWSWCSAPRRSPTRAT